MLRNAQDPDAPVAVLDCRKDVHLRAIEHVSGEEVQRQDPLRLESQELRPARAVPARSRVDPGVLEVCHTVDGATMMPSPASSPWIRRYPHD